MSNNVIDGLATAAAQPVTVQVINQGQGIWGNVATGLITAAAAILAVMLTHQFTLRREKLASEEQLSRERHFIATELIFMLEQFAQGCARVARDEGEPDLQGEYSISVAVPELKMDDITGDWRTLPALIMYRIRELPILLNDAIRYIAGISEYDSPPDYTDSFRERQYQYARLGLKALILSHRLRKLARLPGTRLDATEWSAQPVLWQVWRNERKRRYEKAKKDAAKHEEREQIRQNATLSGEQA